MRAIYSSTYFSTYLPRGYWLLKSWGGSLGGKVLLSMQGWNLKKYLRDAWGKRPSWGCSFIQESRDPECRRESRQDHPREVCWQVRGPLRSTHKSRLEAPVVCLKHTVCVILDIWSLLKILLHSVERVTQSMSYSRMHWLNVFFLISVLGGVGFVQ